MEEQFKLIDQDGTGVINKKELVDVMNENTDHGTSQEEIDQILSEIDYDNNGSINYSEFLAATLPVEKYVT